MRFAHLTLPTRDVQQTAAFFESAFGCRRNPAPSNSPMETVWLDIGDGQEFHVIHIAGFEASPFEAEFGRHTALLYPPEDFPTLKQRLVDAGATLIDPLRATSFERLFFRDPVNGYVFEVIAR